MAILLPKDPRQTALEQIGTGLGKGIGGALKQKGLTSAVERLTREGLTPEGIFQRIAAFDPDFAKKNLETTLLAEGKLQEKAVVDALTAEAVLSGRLPKEVAPEIKSLAHLGAALKASGESQKASTMQQLQELVGANSQAAKNLLAVKAGVEPSDVFPATGTKPIFKKVVDDSSETGFSWVDLNNPSNIIPNAPTTGAGKGSKVKFFDPRNPSNVVEITADEQGRFTGPSGFLPAIPEATRGLSAEAAGRAALIETALQSMDNVISTFNTELVDSEGKLNRATVAAFNAPKPIRGVTLNPGLKKARVDLRNAIGAKLRVETGAVANEEEIKEIFELFAPSVFDTADVVNHKLSILKFFLRSAQGKIDPTGRFTIQEPLTEGERRARFEATKEEALSLIQSNPFPGESTDLNKFFK